MCFFLLRSKIKTYRLLPCTPPSPNSSQLPTWLFRALAVLEGVPEWRALPALTPAREATCFKHCLHERHHLGKGPLANGKPENH